MCLAQGVAVHLHTVRAEDQIPKLYVLYIFITYTHIYFPVKEKSGNPTSLFSSKNHLASTYSNKQLMQHFQMILSDPHLLFFSPPIPNSQSFPEFRVCQKSFPFSHLSTCPPPLRRRGRAARQPPTWILSGRCMTHNTQNINHYQQKQALLSLMQLFKAVATREKSIGTQQTCKKSKGCECCA